MADCQEEDPAKSELFIVEGESAGGSAKQARDRKRQAVLPLKGKILNVEKARFDKMLSSTEVVTLITALGCGIGREEYSPEKIRYHHIIIMTDADVDGSHIRTLLLTFFYRQMPELIEKGYIYIAQPPLFKVKKNKQERYVKDEKALEDLLIQSALDGATIHLGDNSQLTGDALKQVVKEYQQAMHIIQKLSKRYPKAFLELLMTMPLLSESQLMQKAYMETLIKEIEDQLRSQSLGVVFYDISLAEDLERHWFLPKITMTMHGIIHNFLISKDLFLSPDYKKYVDIGNHLKQLMKAGAYIARDDKKETVSTFGAAMNWLINEAKKGQSIKRYKGLGEMNPDQLWETTMAPDTRCLLQVKVEDAVMADQMFTTLMGDEVEPRRQFIELNALDATNIDT